MPNYIFGDSVGRDSIEQGGHHNRLTITNSEGASTHDLNAAITELHDFVEQLRSAGIVAGDGSVTNPGALVVAVQSQPCRLKALTKAIASGAKDAILSVAKDSVSALIVGLVTGQI